MPHKDPEAARAYRRAFYLAHHEEKLAYQRFHGKKHYHKNRAAILRKRAQRSAAHKAYCHLYYQKTKDVRKLYQQSPAYRAKNILYQRARRAADPEGARAKRRAHYAAHPQKYKDAVKHRRYGKRARHLGVAATLTREQWLLIQGHQDHCCAYCGKRCKGKLTQDHILALSKGGTHTLHNVIGACVSCNSRKQAGPPPVPVQPLLL
jgi:hypothetical protein